MRTVNFLLAAILAATVLTSCSRSDEPVTGNDRVEVKFSANTAEICTRVTETGWDAGDPVGIYMIKADPGTLAPGNIVEEAGNRQYEADASGSGAVSFMPQPGEAIYYPVSGDVEFIAYHPYAATVPADFKLPVSKCPGCGGVATGTYEFVAHLNRGKSNHDRQMNQEFTNTTMLLHKYHKDEK
ncbi:MAG: fimbrillin family protein [Bacteroidales bacterium]|jgi:hypothetical protein|nr:fimbrillin family protein [Bacteroidales bacterium]